MIEGGTLQELTTLTFIEMCCLIRSSHVCESAFVLHYVLMCVQMHNNLDDCHRTMYTYCVESSVSQVMPVSSLLKVMCIR